ncbi:MAG: aldo/keto reductase [Gemmatimonadota bacterium]|jgi:predicted aldo/keto reductase-like oxidoreductase
MSGDPRPNADQDKLSRRSFVKASGVTLAGGLAAAATGSPTRLGGESVRQDPRIQSYKTLGRTGWRVSDIAFGTGPLRDPTLVRAAFDRGINYFDTAESYGNGAAERAIGDALPHIGREKVFIASKAVLRGGETESEVVDRVRRSLDRLKTDYVDSYSMHHTPTVEFLNHPGYHAAIERLKAEGRVRFAGVSYHGPSRTGQGNMAEVLSAAASDGRFDMMLLVYNFMNSEQGDQILAACKANNVGTTIMKSAPGVLHHDAWDPENMTDEQRSFAERYGLRTEDQLRFGSIQWVLQNPDAHTVCVSLNDFDNIDRVVALSGTTLSESDEESLHRLASSADSRYCRHGCVECAGACPQAVPVSRIMRYAYYFEVQGREKHAMSRYAQLGGPKGEACADCSAPCDTACPYGFSIRAQLSKAHPMLTLV